MILKLLVMYARTVWGIAPAAPDMVNPMWHVVCGYGVVVDVAAVAAVAWLVVKMTRD